MSSTSSINTDDDEDDVLKLPHFPETLPVLWSQNRL